MKSNENDVTQLVDDLSLNKLLEGTFEFPSSSNEKTKKLENSNDSVMPLVRKACSVLQPHKPAKSENLDNSDSFTNNKTSTDVLTSLSVDDGCNDGDNGEPSTTELSTESKVRYYNLIILVYFFVLPTMWKYCLMFDRFLALPNIHLVYHRWVSLIIINFMNNNCF